MKVRHSKSWTHSAGKWGEGERGKDRGGKNDCGKGRREGRHEGVKSVERREEGR